MPIAVSSRSFSAAQPLDEDIRLAAVCGFPWLVLDAAKMQVFLNTPDFDIRDLKRLFLRTQPAALDALTLASFDSAYLPLAEQYCKDARRLNAPVLIVRCDAPDERLLAFAEVAQRWSTVLALVPSTGQFGVLTALLEELNHPALAIYLDLVELHRGGESLTPAEAARVALVGVGDETIDGVPALPGQGWLPTAPLLAPLIEGGFNGLYVLDVPDGASAVDAEAWARDARAALLDVLAQAGWAEESL